MAAIKSRLNFWIAVGQISANLFTWGRILLAVSEPYVVDPVMDPEIRELRDHIPPASTPGSPGRSP
jgi:hypothetical protein